MASSRKEQQIPPARPPAPKLSLSKMKGRQHSTGSIAIRFSASSVDEDYDPNDEVTLGSSPNEVVKFEVGSVSNLATREQSPAKQMELGDGETIKQNAAKCRSAPASGVTTPILSQDPACIDRAFPKSLQDGMVTKEDGEKSLFSGIRERLHDPLTSLLEKVEELSGESGIAEAIDRKLKVRAGSVENDNGQITRPCEVEFGQVHELPAIVQTNVTDTKHFVPSQDMEAETLDGDLSDVSRILNGTRDETRDELWTRTGSFEIVDDFYAEPDGAIDGMVRTGSSPKQGRPLVKSNSSDQILQQQTAIPCKDAVQKPAKARQRVNLKKPKGKGDGEKPVSMSLSAILSSTTKDLEDALIEEEQFYDVDDSSELPERISVGKMQGAHYGPSQDADLVLPAVPLHRVVTGIVCLLAYLIIPLPSFLSGAVFGATVATLGISFYLWLTAPPKPCEPFELPDLDTLPALIVPEMRDSKNEGGKFRGWMNELHHYDQENYHINQTQSVYVQLEGTSLRLQTPKQNVPKRSMWNEPQNYSPTFIAQRHLDLVGSKVSLLPAGLVKKRLWSKKYPICVESGSGLGRRGGQKAAPVEPLIPSSQNQAVAGFQGQSQGQGQAGTGSTLLYLFARTGREKEEWFRRLDAASKGTPLPTKIMELVHKLEGRPVRTPGSASTTPVTADGGMKHKKQGFEDLALDQSKEESTDESEKTPEELLTEYIKYMAKSMPADSAAHFRPSAIPCEPVFIWTNALMARGFWDFLREDYWAEKVKDKIQKKLSKIHVPYFIDELTVTGIVLGREVPVIRRVSKPFLDDRGLWVDVDVAYRGGFQMSLETKVNLMKLKKTKSPRELKSVHNKRSPVTDEEEEDSCESSTDDEAVDDVIETADDRTQTSGGGGTSKKILRLVDKITQSKYFQQATEYKYIKKAMEGVSNTRLMLNVELRSLIGTLAVNIPPPPTDRLWYGFRTNPRLWLSAKPKVGSREVSVSHITDWIEKKLTIEFQRVFVMPNMDDLLIPLLFDHIPEPSQTPQQLHQEQLPRSADPDPVPSSLADKDNNPS